MDGLVVSAGQKRNIGKSGGEKCAMHDVQGGLFARTKLCAPGTLSHSPTLVVTLADVLSKNLLLQTKLGTHSVARLHKANVLSS